MKKYLAWILICSLMLGVFASCNQETPSSAPSSDPTETPTQKPTEKPTQKPTEKPTETPTQKPTETPTEPQPTENPTQTPTEAPTQAPTEAPTQAPTEAPTQTPTEAPTTPPTEQPTEQPTEPPTEQPTEPPTEPPTEQPTEPPYELPKLSVDLTSASSVSSSLTGAHSLSTSFAGGVASLNFIDSGAGYVDDPYVSLKLPSTQINCQEYPYIAILVKTSEPIIEGELRFMTTTTGTSFPCQPFTHQYDDGWQLIVSKLTDLSTEKYYNFTSPFTGNYTQLRLDLYYPGTPGSGMLLPDTEYYIKAYAFFKTAEEAAEMIKFKPDVDSSDEETPNVNYEDFWLGEQFEKPANDKRMNWVHYGFGQSTTPVDRFLKEGYGGIVSNVNFNQNYLKSAKEFAILKDVYGYAADHDMTLWIYDEYQWPSGKAFGLVLDRQPGREWESTGIEHIVITGSGGIAAYKLGDKYGDIELGIMQAILTDSRGSTTLNVNSDLSVTSGVAGDWTLDVYILRYTYNETENRNDFTTLRDVDLLNPDAVKCFIELTHQQYKDNFGEAFNNITAFFTDEPQLGNRGMADYVVWTDGLAERFYETYGYEINIPSLFSGDEGYDRMIRLNYYQLVATMFKESYIDQITEWCEANGVASSGHLLFEEDMNDHIETYGGNFMQVVGGMTIPGVDVLWVDPYNLLRQNFIGNYMGLRYVSSAAKNAGKNDVMIEFNPNAVSALNNYEDKLGVSLAGLSITRLLGTNTYNVINPTRDYTISELNKMNTYIGRLNTILDETVECGELAVFYPIATVQAYHDADNDHSSETGSGNTKASEINTNYETICLKLLQNQLLFTVIDDESIRQAQITADGKMIIGLGSYSTIVLPYTEYISVEALQKLADFENAGGTVIFYKSNIAHGLELDQEDEIAEILSTIGKTTANSQMALVRKIKETVTTSLTATVKTGVSTNLLMGDFTSETHNVSFLVNTGASDMTVQWSYTDGYTGSATIYYPGSGNIETVELSKGGEVIIPAYQGILIVREK